MVKHYIRAGKDTRILDIGCGTATILDHLPDDVEYIGYDLSQNYIDAAIRKYGHRASFKCANVNDITCDDDEKFDVVLAHGLLHHLDDDQVLKLMNTAYRLLKVGGRFITRDGCYADGQSPIAKAILDRDRGQNVRDRAGYERLTKPFEKINVVMRSDTLRVPSTHIFMELTR